MSRLANSSAYRDASVETLLGKAQEVVSKELDRCTIFNEAALEAIPRFDPEECVVGKVIGRGGFCVVRELTAIRLLPEGAEAGEARRRLDIESRWGNRSTRRQASSSSLNSNSYRRGSSASLGAKPEGQSREILARKVWNKKAGKYVVKQVEPLFIHTDKVTYLKGTIDLALEAHYLASLQHPHILQIRGLARASPYEETGYFLILDELQQTLSKRLNIWMNEQRNTRGITGFVTGGRRKEKSLMTDRLLVAFDVAQAMDFIHSYGIIYRDLKPDNIGFDVTGCVKIFDFGLAKELMEEDREENGLYRMTGCTGALRYMAPEVGLYKPYNLKADVYSWSMLMWYIMALEPPFGLFSQSMMTTRVFQLGARPATQEGWPNRLCVLLKKCWSETIEERPNFSEIMAVMKALVHEFDPQISSFMGSIEP